jgi:DNA polymerase-3 subunit epsilon
MMTRTTGIRPEDVADARTADQVLAELDTAMPAGLLLLVAQHAPVEASLLFNHRDHCPRLAATALLDTRLLAKALHPQLPSFGLDALITAFNLPRPSDRHRALADCTVLLTD